MTRKLLAIFLLLTASWAARAETYLVDPEGTGDFPTIQAAISAATDGDIIELANGTFTGEGNFDLEFLGKAITVRSASGDPGSCVIDCFDGIRGHRGIYFHAGEGAGSVLQGVTITGGWASGPVFPWLRGGAIYCVGASPEIRDCVFRDNRSYDIEGYSIGGAIASVSGGSPAIIDCLFEGNLSSLGGAISGEFGLVEGCTFVGNRAFDEGGESRGGAVYLAFQNTILENCTLVYNEADDGAGFFCQDCAPHVENTIVAFNGPGQAVGVSGATVSVICSDLHGNEGGDWTGVIADQFGINGNISLNPLFCWSDPETTTEWTLHSDSPCAPGISVCGLIGAWGVGCGSSPIRDCNWGELKALFRSQTR
ncbi:MAG: hypothetical protein KAY32_17660 [Candidatus Eisenbacteria sp.]|nr:hypothetical protein [Candidatus Eisenbacteria bacterium]